MGKRKQSTRSHLLEIILALVAVGAIYAWMANGGPKGAGKAAADQIAPAASPSR